MTTRRHSLSRFQVGTGVRGRGGGGEGEGG